MRQTERQRDAGFTLIEIIVVLVILGLLGGLVLTRGPMRSGAVDMRAGVSQALGSLRLARARAIVSNRLVAVRFQPDGATFQIGAEPVRRLPRGITLASGTASIVFRPDGSSTGGTLQLAGEAQRAEIEVSWLTGRAAATAVP